MLSKKLKVFGSHGWVKLDKGPRALRSTDGQTRLVRAKISIDSISIAKMCNIAFIDNFV